MQLPPLPESRLSPVSSMSTVEPSFLGYTAESWLEVVAREGPVFRTVINGEEACIICGREADLTAWKTPDNWMYGPPAPGGEFFREELGESHVTQLDGEAHRRVRKLILPAFGVAAVTRDLPAVGERVEAGLRAMEGETNLHPVLSRIIAGALNISQLKEDPAEALIDAMVTYEESFIPAVGLAPENRQRWYARPAFQSARQQAFSYFERVADERLAGTRKEDSLDLVLHRSVPEGMTSLTREELVSVVYLLSVAGVGNIANILCAAIWALAQYPEWHGRLMDELRDFSAPDLRQGMGRYPVLKALISEVERCYLPAPVIPKMSAADQAFLGYEIPAGMNVMHLHGLAHFDASRYADPFTFDPGRWLTNSPERANAFGGGAHLCLGMGVTRLYTPLLLALFVQQFDWQSAGTPMIVPQEAGLDYSPTTTRFTCRLVSR